MPACSGTKAAASTATFLSRRLPCSISKPTGARRPAVSRCRSARLTVPCNYSQRLRTCLPLWPLRAERRLPVRWAHRCTSDSHAARHNSQCWCRRGCRQGYVDARGGRWQYSRCEFVELDSSHHVWKRIVYAHGAPSLGDDWSGSWLIYLRCLQVPETLRYCFRAPSQVWSVPRPYLYTLLTTVQVDGTGAVVDNVTTSIGLRDVQFTSDEGMFLNEQVGAESHPLLSVLRREVPTLSTARESARLLQPQLIHGRWRCGPRPPQSSAHSGSDN